MNKNVEGFLNSKNNEDFKIGIGRAIRSIEAEIAEFVLRADKIIRLIKKRNNFFDDEKKMEYFAIEIEKAKTAKELKRVSIQSAISTLNILVNPQILETDYAPFRFEAAGAAGESSRASLVFEMKEIYSVNYNR